MFKKLFLNVRVWFACLFLSKKEAKVVRNAISKYLAKKEYVQVVRKSMYDGTFWNVMMGKNHMPDDRVAIVKMPEEFKQIISEEKSVYLSPGSINKNNDVRPDFRQLNQKAASVLESVADPEGEDLPLKYIAPETQVISMREGYPRKKDGKYIWMSQPESETKIPCQPGLYCACGGDGATANSVESLPPVWGAPDTTIIEAHE